MNSIKLDVLTLTEKGHFQEDIQGILSDPQLRSTVILRRRGTQTFDPTTGINTHAWTSTQTYALKGGHSTTEMPSGKGFGIMEFGDVCFLIPLKDINDVVELDKDDRILELVYDSGAVSATKGSTTVTGDATEWVEYASQGNFFKMEAEPLSYLNEVASITNDTTLVLTDNYAGETKSNQSFQIWKEHFVVGVQRDTFTGLVIKYWCREIT